MRRFVGTATAAGTSTGSGVKRFGEYQPHRRALTDQAIDADLRAVPLHHAVDHREPQAGAALTLGREERFETAAARVVIHADAGVGDLHQHVPRVRRARAQRECAALGHRIDGIEDEIGERLANLAFRAHDDGQRLRELASALRW